MRIIVINLARATERRQRIEEQFAAFGLEFEILEATDGRHITDAERALVDHARRRCITPYPLTDNEIGCWISHRRAMEALVAGGQKMAAILEDDAVLTPDFPRVLAALEARALPFDAIDLHRRFKKGEIFALCHPFLPGYGLGRIGYTHMNLTAYVISRAGAQKFLASARKFVHMVDKAMHRYWDNGLDLYGLETPVADQAKGHSYIEETRHQGRLAIRARYPDADRFYWRCRRFFARVVDSVRKRRAFPAYVRRGRKTLSSLP